MDEPLAEDISTNLDFVHAVGKYALSPLPLFHPPVHSIITIPLPRIR